MVFYNPPVVNRALGIRRSYLNETRRIARELLDRGQQTLVFANSRLATEILLTYLKDDHSGVRGYRGGYLPEGAPRDRTQAARRRDSRGGRDQRAGAGHRYRIARCGGDGRISRAPSRPPGSARAAPDAGRPPSLAVLVASSAPLDQYIIEHPEYFFDRPPEHAHINPDNLEILINHLKCAAFELPIRDGEKFGPHDTCGAVPVPGGSEASASFGHAQRWHWTSDTYPADAVSLRAGIER